MKKIISDKKINSYKHSQKYASKFLRKKINKNDDFAIWLVDGASIRKNVNENFVEYGNHNLFSFIPKNQLWIDQDLNPKEYHYFIERFTYENKLIDSGTNYEKAEKISDVFERKERQNSQEIRKATKNGHNKKELLPKIKKRLLKKYSGKIKIWLADESIVRAFYLIDYCEGGHDLVYSFIPKNDIWIEQAISPKERKFIILHELHERYLMLGGKSYKNAHKGATEVEDFYRENPKENIEKRIKEEMKKNDDFNR